MCMTVCVCFCCEGTKGGKLVKKIKSVKNVSVFKKKNNKTENMPSNGKQNTECDRKTLENIYMNEIKLKNLAF